MELPDILPSARVTLFNHVRLLAKTDKQRIAVFFFVDAVILNRVEDWYLESPCKGFNPTLTDSGICYSYNSKTLGEIYKRSDYVDMMGQHFFEEGLTVEKSVFSGENMKMVIGLDSQTSR